MRGSLVQRQFVLPVDDGVPQHALIAAIQIPVERIEIERHNLPRPCVHIQYRRTPDEVLLTPSLPAHHERSPVAVSPFVNHTTRIYGTVETCRAVRHPQPMARERV